MIEFLRLILEAMSHSFTMVIVLLPLGQDGIALIVALVVPPTSFIGEFVVVIGSTVNE